MPCPPTRCRAELLDYSRRLKWDLETITDASNPRLKQWGDDPDGEVTLVWTESKPAAGGLISPREFLDIGKTYKVGDSWRHVSKSVKSPDYPEVRKVPILILI